MKVYSLVGVILSSIVIGGVITPVSAGFAKDDDTVSRLSTEKNTIQSPSSVEGTADSKTITMNDAMAQLNLTETEKAEVQAAVIYAVQHSKEARSRYYYLTYKLSAKEVKKMSGYTGAAGTVISNVAAIIGNKYGKAGKYVTVASAMLYGSYWWQVTRASINGWGLKVTLKVDSYTPTTSGMAWTVTYVK